MDRKGKRRKNRGEAKNSAKDDSRKEIDKECGTTKSKTGEVRKGNKGTSDEVSPVFSGTNSEKCISNSKEKLKTEPETSLEEETSNHHDTYKKRQIKSNWERYEESQTEDKADEKKGADINLLLQSSGGSFFRFRDEQEWEEIQETKAQNSEFLSLNSEDLAKAISCIPLPSRLMINEDLFPPKLINKFNKSAKENMQRYKTGHQYNEGKGDVAHTDSPPTEHLQKTLLSLLNDNLEDSDDKPDRIEVENDNKKINTSQDYLDSEPVDIVQTNLPKASEKNLKKTSSSSVQKETAPSKITHPVVPDDLENDEENELNYLLSLNVPVKPEVKCLDKVQQGSVVKESKKVVAQENVSLFPESKAATSLEDWLDEMLDDD